MEAREGQIPSKGKEDHCGNSNCSKIKRNALRRWSSRSFDMFKENLIGTFTDICTGNSSTAEEHELNKCFLLIPKLFGSASPV